ncbi:MAG: hypothetical protein LC808_05055 [Actinobacteria bacterium]|nr:hypothetical protein [Actinomycetota bacterium]
METTASIASLALLHALSAYPTNVKVTTLGGGEHRVTGVRLGAEGVQVRLTGGDWIKMDAVTSFTGGTS